MEEFERAMNTLQFENKVISFALVYFIDLLNHYFEWTLL